MFGLTGEMLRAARALARVDQLRVAELAGVSVETIKRLERIHGPVNASSATLEYLRKAFAGLGVSFFCEAGGSGVRLDTGAEPPRAIEVTPPKSPAQLCCAIYHSVATAETQANAPAVMNDILEAAVDLNGRLSVTGALLYANGRFLQALEGDPADVWRVLGGIAMDRRHRDFTPVTRSVVTERLFPDWVLCANSDRGTFESEEIPVFEHMTTDAALDLLIGLSQLEREALRRPVD